MLMVDNLNVDIERYADPQKPQSVELEKRFSEKTIVAFTNSTVFLLNLFGLMFWASVPLL